MVASLFSPGVRGFFTMRKPVENYKAVVRYQIVTLARLASYGRARLYGNLVKMYGNLYRPIASVTFNRSAETRDWELVGGHFLALTPGSGFSAATPVGPSCSAVDSWEAKGPHIYSPGRGAIR
jgi:hypothetical protein